MPTPRSELSRAWVLSLVCAFTVMTAGCARSAITPDNEEVVSIEKKPEDAGGGSGNGQGNGNKNGGKNDPNEPPPSDPPTNDPPPDDPGDPEVPPGSVVRNEDLTHRQVFPKDNWWNLDISNAPVDPRSEALIATVREDSRVWGDMYDRFHPDMGSGVKTRDDGTVWDNYGLPYVVVSGDQPLQKIHFKNPTDSPPGWPAESDHEWEGRPGGYPIPDQVRDEWGWIQHGTPGGGDDEDYHLMVIDRDNWILYELWHAKWEEGVGWTAGSGAVWDMNANNRRPAGWTSADAAGMAIFPGLLRADEVFGPNEIEHAMRVTFRRTADYYVWPANHKAGWLPDQLPNGARIRMKPDFDISGYPPEVQKVFRAWKKYGLIVADNGGPGYVTATMDARWDNDVWNPAFHSLTLSNFDIVELGWDPYGRGN